MYANGMGVAKEITTALVKSTVQRKVGANPVRLTAMRAGAYQRGRHEAQADRERDQVKMMSFEVELAGLAVEFKAKRLQGMVTGLAALTALAAIPPSRACRTPAPRSHAAPTRHPDAGKGSGHWAAR